jgi:hypothetical protein
MGLRDVTASSVLSAMSEFDRLGRDAFQQRYGFGPARSYLLVHEGRSYDSKAIVGAAHGFARPDLGPLTSADFSGGVLGAAAVLRDLGFQVDGVTSRAPAQQAPRPSPSMLPPPTGARSDVVLVGCVKTKRSTRAPAQELYSSALFRKRRAYAEATGRPWFILSALHGLVDPEDVLDPYDMALAAQGAAYRSAWGKKVVAQLVSRVPALGLVIEIHAGSAYVDAIESELTRLGAAVSVPLRGLNQGQHLAWYAAPAVEGPPKPWPRFDVESLARQLSDAAAARPCGEFPWGRTDLQAPGLYSWWTDTAGAHELSAGLGQRVAAGLLYAGQAGASSSVAGIERGSTLSSRIRGNHLNGSTSSSTWRRTLAAALGLGLGDPQVLSDWMRQHLKLIAVPVEDRAGLAVVEQQVLERIDPPLNLMHTSPTPLRAALRSARTALDRTR